MTMHIVLLVVLFLIYYFIGGDKSMDSMVIRKKQTIWMGLMLFLFAALRSYTVGQDVLGYPPEYHGYYYDYSQYANYSIKDLIIIRANRDPFFTIFFKLFSIIFPSPQFMLIVIGGMVAFSFSYYTYHEKGNVLLFYMMFIGFRIFSFTLSGLRQAMAMSFIFIAFILLRKDKIWKSILFTVVACLFHRSALIFFMSFPLNKIKKAFIVPSLLFLVLLFNVITDGSIANTMGHVFFGGRFDSYIRNSEGMEFEGGATFYIYLVIYAFALLLFKPLKKEDNVNYVFDFNLFSVGLFFSVMGQYMSNVFRIAYYFIFVSFPIMGQVISVFVKNKSAISFFVFMLSVALSVQYVVLGTGAGTENYQFFWNEPYY